MFLLGFQPVDKSLPNALESSTITADPEFGSAAPPTIHAYDTSVGHNNVLRQVVVWAEGGV